MYGRERYASTTYYDLDADTKRDTVAGNTDTSFTALSPRRVCEKLKARLDEREGKRWNIFVKEE